MVRKPKNPKDTIYFHYYNANSKGHKVGDCVIRAISAILEQPWETTFDDLVSIARKNCRMPNDRLVYRKYLISKGFIKMDEPRTLENKKIRVCDFVKDHPNLTAVASLGTRHCAAIINGLVYDIWDSSNQILHTYYVKED